MKSVTDSYTDAQLAFELEDFIGGRITCDDGMNYTTMEIPGHKWQRIIAALKRSALNPEAAWPFPKRHDGPKGEWIACSERLPEPNGPDIFVLGTKFDDRCAWSASPGGFVDTTWAAKYSITHWMPMSELPLDATGDRHG